MGIVRPPVFPIVTRLDHIATLPQRRDGAGCDLFKDIDEGAFHHFQATYHVILQVTRMVNAAPIPCQH